MKNKIVTWLNGQVVKWLHCYIVKLFIFFLLITNYYLLITSPVFAQADESGAIWNPVLDKIFGRYEYVRENPLGALIARLWMTMVIIGGLALIVFLIWGGLDWLMSEGNEQKLKAARDKINHALLGMAVLAGTYALVKLIEAVFGLSIFEIPWGKLAPKTAP